MTIERKDLAGVTWVDPRDRQKPGRDRLMLLVSQRADRGRPVIRINVTASACRWFRNRGQDRVRLLFSQDGRFVALEPSFSGQTVSGNTTPSFVVAPEASPLRAGMNVELEAMGSLLVGAIPPAAKEDA